MVKLIEVQCPHCRQDCDIFLTTSAYLIVLNCPRCWQPIMYHNRQCVGLSREQIRQIECAGHESAVQEVLQNIVRGASGNTNPASGTKMRKRVSGSKPKDTIRAVHPPRALREGGIITGDDITNLRIELGLCETIEDFIGCL